MLGDGCLDRFAHPPLAAYHLTGSHAHHAVVYILESALLSSKSLLMRRVFGLLELNR